MLIYELKIPLTIAAEGGFTLGQLSGNIGIGFMEGKSERANKDRTEGEFSERTDRVNGDPSGGMGGERGRKGGGGRRQEEFKSGGKSTPFDIWLTIDLAGKKK